MEIEVYEGMIGLMVKYKEFRRTAEKFKRDEDRQDIHFTWRYKDGVMYDDSIYVRQIEPNCYIFA